MRISTIFQVIIVTLLTLFAAAPFLPSNTGHAAKESTYERILRTGEIRCGYSVWAPLFSIDARTGEKRGIFHDLMEEAAKRLGLKIVWTEELGWGSVVEAVKSGRVDAACSGYWSTPARVKYLQPSAPLFYSPMYVWMRQDDTRATRPEDLNDPRFKAGTIDGSAESQILARRFAKASLLTLPEMDTSSDLIENLTSKKADFILVDTSTMQSYLAHNPGKVKNAFPSDPMDMFSFVVLLPPDDMRFKAVIDNTLRSLEHDGTLDDIFARYGMKDVFMRNALPAQTGTHSNKLPTIAY